MIADTYEVGVATVGIELHDTARSTPTDATPALTPIADANVEHLLDVSTGNRRRLAHKGPTAAQSPHRPAASHSRPT